MCWTNGLKWFRLGSFVYAINTIIPSFFRSKGLFLFCCKAYNCIGGIDKDDDIATRVFYPFDTAGDFDIRLMTFHMMSHLFGEYNEALEDAKQDE